MTAPGTPSPSSAASASTGSTAARPGGRLHLHPPGLPATDDWPRQATEQIVKVVDTVRDKTTGPALTAAAGVKYGVLIVLLGLPLAVLLLIALMRGCERGLIALGLDEPMWIVDLVFGAVFLAAGVVLWRKSSRTEPTLKDLP